MADSLEARVAAAIGEPVVEISPLAGGASFQTERVVLASGRQLVLRHDPNQTNLEPLEPKEFGWERAGVPLDIEAELLRRAEAHGVPVPKVAGVMPASATSGSGLLAEFLEGEALGHKIARGDRLAAVRPSLANQCGRALAGIHRIEPHGLGLDLVTPTGFVDATHQRYRQLCGGRPLLDGVARWLLDCAPDEVEPVVVHGDFRNGNIMVHEEAGLVGVLDWELAHLGDPAQDLGYLLLNSWRFGQNRLEVGGFGEVTDLLRGYGGQIAEERVRWWQAAGSFWWAVTCLFQASRFRQGTSGEFGGVEYPAIGRRVTEAEVDCANLIIPGSVPAPPSAHGAHTPGDLTDLLAGLTGLLRSDLGLEGKQRFLARVGANAADIVRRDVLIGSQIRDAERGRLSRLFDDPKSSLGDLRNRLCDELWSGTRSMLDPQISEHLRVTTAHQLAVDQPGYDAPPVWPRSAER